MDTTNQNMKKDEVEPSTIKSDNLPKQEISQSRSAITITHFGTATILLEIGPFRILTDPALDEPGKHYSLGWGLGSTKSNEAIVSPEALGHIDVVLLSHDEHADNLDDKGRALLPSVGKVLTTPSGAKRLSSAPSSLKNVTGMKDWESYTLSDSKNWSIKITATPARHGPPLSSLIVGDVIGFLLEWEGQAKGALYISGDTVLFDGVMEVGKRFRVGTSILHLGGVQFTLSGPLRYTFSGEEAAIVAKTFDTEKVIPIHYEGWSHFRENKAQSEKSFEKAGITKMVQWLDIGKPTVIEV